LGPCRAGLGAVEQAVAERAAKSHTQLQGLFTALQGLQRVVLQRATVPAGDLLEVQRLFAEIVHGLGSLSRYVKNILPSTHWMSPLVLKSLQSTMMNLDNYSRQKCFACQNLKVVLSGLCIAFHSFLERTTLTMIVFENLPEYIPCSLIGGGLHSLIPPKAVSDLPAAASPPAVKEQAAHVALAAELLVLKQRMSSLESERARLSAEAASLREEVGRGHRTLDSWRWRVCYGGIGVCQDSIISQGTIRVG
jgi:hypothetical protein